MRSSENIILYVSVFSSCLRIRLLLKVTGYINMLVPLSFETMIVTWLSWNINFILALYSTQSALIKEFLISAESLSLSCRFQNANLVPLKNWPSHRFVYRLSWIQIKYFVCLSRTGCNEEVFKYFHSHARHRLTCNQKHEISCKKIWIFSSESAVKFLLLLEIDLKPPG